MDKGLSAILRLNDFSPLRAGLFSLDVSRRTTFYLDVNIIIRRGGVDDVSFSGDDMPRAWQLRQVHVDDLHALFSILSCFTFLCLML